MIPEDSKPVAIFLCDLTGHMAEPWAQNGHHVILVDPQHPEGFNTEGNVTRVGATIVECAAQLGHVIRSGRVVFACGFPPCTDVSLSGTRWWAKKREQDPYFQAKAAMVAEQCRMVGMLSGCPWFFENPASAFSRMFGAPQHKFHPYQFTGHCPADNYRKETWLWSGGGFVMPSPFMAEGLPKPDDRIHKAPPGEGRANFRSATPRGFAIAVHAANSSTPAALRARRRHLPRPEGTNSMRRTEHSTTVTTIELEPQEVREALELQARAGKWGPLADPDRDTVEVTVNPDGTAVIQVTNNTSTANTGT